MNFRDKSLKETGPTCTSFGGEYTKRKNPNKSPIGIPIPKPKTSNKLLINPIIALYRLQNEERNESRTTDEADGMQKHCQIEEKRMQEDKLRMWGDEEEEKI